MRAREAEPMEFYRPEHLDHIRNIIKEAHIAYASMEIACHPDVHTYSGGLGVLAGDTLRSCADLEVPVVAITLLYRKGYFSQRLEHGWQTEQDEPWDIEKYTSRLPEGRVIIEIEGREVTVEPRVGIIVGMQKHLVPVLFLDTDLEENDWRDRGISWQLYGGDQTNRIKQEAVLGIAGKRVLRKLGCLQLHTFHMNEGHAAFAPMEDMRYLSKYYKYNRPAVTNLVKSAHVFTTHTPVPAGHDRFSYEQVRDVVGNDFLHIPGGPKECNMTHLALNLSRYANGVAKKHGQVSRRMFPGYKIDAITNGVHLPTWMNCHIQELLDKELPSWRHEPGILEHVYQIVDHDELCKAHDKAKRDMIDYIKHSTGVQLDEKQLTIGFARRFAPYKRADLIFTEIERLIEMGCGKIQLVFAGEAHPKDEEGKRIIQRVIARAAELRDCLTVVFLEDYNMAMSQKLVAGCDLWLNNPVPPKEASGTSGMKAAANAVPNLSTLDGWWIEGITKNAQGGWIIQHRDDGQDHKSLYDVLGHIIRVYYEHPKRWRQHMASALALASYFNTHRMVNEYLDKSWTLTIY